MKLIDWFEENFTNVLLNSEVDTMLLAAVKSFVKKNTKFLEEDTYFLSTYKDHILEKYGVVLVPKSELDVYNFDAIVKNCIQILTIPFGNYYASTVKYYKNLTECIDECHEYTLSYIKQFLNGFKEFDVTLTVLYGYLLLVIKNGDVTYNIEIPKTILEYDKIWQLEDFLKNNIFRVK